MARQVDELYYTLRLRTDQLPADEAAAKAQLDAITKAVEATGAKVEQVTTEAVKRTTEATEDAARKVAESGRQIARQMTESLRKTFEADKDKIKIALEAGIMTPAEAQAAGRRAAMAYNEGVVSTIATIKGTGAAEGERGAAILAGLKQEFVAVDQAATAASYGGLSYIRRPLTTMADQALGVNRSIGTLASGLGAFSIGNAWTIAVVAGIALIAGTYDLLTKSSREARKAIDDVIDGLVKQREEQRETDAQRAHSQVITATNEVNRLEAIVANLRASAKAGSQNQDQGVIGAGASAGLAAGNLEQALKDLARAREALAQANLNEADSNDKISSSYTEQLLAVAKSGEATKRQISDLKLLSTQARTTLDAFKADPIAQAKYAVAHPGDPNAVLDYEQQLTEQANAYQEYLDKLKKGDDKNARDRERLLNEQNAYAAQVNAALARYSPTSGEDSLEVQLTRLAEAGQRAHIPLAQVQADAQHIRDAFKSAAGREGAALLQQAMDEALGPVGRMQSALDKLVAQARAHGVSEDIIKQLVAIKQPAIDAAAAMQKVNDALDEVRLNREARTAGIGTTTPMQDMGTLLTQLDAANAAVDKAQRGTEAYRQALAAVLKIMQQIHDLQNDTAKSNKDATAGANDGMKELKSRVTQVIAAINAAISLAEEFGKMDQNTAKVVEGVKLGAQAVSDFASGNVLAGVLDGIHAGVDVIKGIFGIHGKSPEQKALEAVLTANTHALIKLNETYGSVAAVHATGREQAIYAQVLSRTDITGETKLHSQQQTYRIEDFLQANGLTLQDFRDYAASFGIKLSDAITAQEFQQLQQAVKSANVTKYADTFAGQMQNLQTTLKLFNITQPTAELQAFGKALDGIRGGGGALSAAIKNFDLTTAYGVQTATKVLQDLYNRAQAGTLSATDLGGLSGQDFIDAIGQLKDMIDQTPAAGTGGYNVSQTITQASSDRVVALLGTGNDWLAQIAMYTAASARALGAAVNLPPLVAPPVAANAAAAGGGITVNVTLPENMIGVSDPQAFGSRVGLGIATELSKALGGMQSWNQRAQGSAAVAS